MPNRLHKPTKSLRKLPLSASAIAVALAFGSAHAATIQPWECTADHGQWDCKALTSEPSLYTKDLTSEQRKQAIANALGWVPDSSDTPGNCSVCGGHYVEPPFPQQGALGSLSASPALGTYSHATYQVNGDVTLTGPLQLTQPSRSLFVGGTATLYPNLKTGQLERLSAQGDIQLHQPGQLLLGNEGAADLFKHQAELQDATYLIQVKPLWQNSGGGTAPDPNFTGYAYGQASTIQQEDANTVILYNTTYSTCPPDSSTWQISAKKIVLNRETQRGEAENTVLKFFNIPVFYSPYLDFPLTDARKSGFLCTNISLTQP